MEYMGEVVRLLPNVWSVKMAPYYKLRITLTHAPWYFQLDWATMVTDCPANVSGFSEEKATWMLVEVCRMEGNVVKGK